MPQILSIPDTKNRRGAVYQNRSSVLYKCMEIRPTDLADAITAELMRVHSLFERADETYRVLRAIITDPDGRAEGWPVEWIPISNH
jgi:hypothetical protein